MKLLKLIRTWKFTLVLLCGIGLALQSYNIYLLLTAAEIKCLKQYLECRILEAEKFSTQLSPVTCI